MGPNDPFANFDSRPAAREPPARRTALVRVDGPWLGASLGVAFSGLILELGVARATLILTLGVLGAAVQYAVRRARQRPSST